ncbi:unnamed protein product [Musa hybrid cultivar]
MSSKDSHGSKLSNGCGRDSERRANLQCCIGIACFIHDSSSSSREIIMLLVSIYLKVGYV